jgi:hypothetical protein
MLAAAMTLLVPLASVAAGNSPELGTLLGAIVTYAIPITLALWIPADLRSRGRTPPFELPFLLLLCWPVSLVWYCVWTRGWTGLGLAMGLAILPYVPVVFTAAIWFAWLVVAS